jgi:hypothetical protein
MYKNKYLILVGGVTYNKTYTNGKLINTHDYIPKNKRFKFNNISSVENKNIKKKKKKNYVPSYNDYFSNMIIIYDIEHDDYHISDYELPLNIADPKIVIKDDILYILGGECNSTLINNVFYGNHLAGLIQLKILF